MKFYQKTWFVILTLLLFAPLGIFLTWKYKPWHKAVKITLSVACMLFFIVGFMGAISNPETTSSSSTDISSENATDSSKDTTKETTSEDKSSAESTEESNTTEESSTKTQEETDEQEITKVVNEEFGEENVNSINYVPDNNYLLIEAKGIESLTSKMTVKGMYLSIYNILKDLTDLDGIDIDFMITYPLQDEYGNITEETVLKATYSYDTRNKINWDNFLWENTPDIADDWWIHSALENALNG